MPDPEEKFAYIVTDGRNEDYAVRGVFLDLDSAKAHIERQWEERIEVWPVGGATDRLGTWHLSRFMNPPWTYESYDDA